MNNLLILHMHTNYKVINLQYDSICAFLRHGGRVRPVQDADRQQAGPGGGRPQGAHRQI